MPTIKGTNGNDLIFASNDDEVILGRGGDDLIEGSGGNDTIDGGGNNDTLYGGCGDDSIEGGAGNDQLYGGHGNDTLEGGSGDDFLVGGDGADYLDGGSGDDFVIAGGDQEYTVALLSETEYEYDYYMADVAHGGTGDDIVMAENPFIVYYQQAQSFQSVSISDTLYESMPDTYLHGDGGNDTVIGGYGYDMLFGESGNDVLEGGCGADTLSGGSGNDTLTGGMMDYYVSAVEGASVELYGESCAYCYDDFDVFAFEVGSGKDVITDFQNGMDLIDLSDYQLDNGFDDLVISEVDGGTLIELPGVATITLLGVDAFEVDASDFIFAII